MSNQYSASTKAQKARDLIDKFPHSSKKQLGKMLFKLNPLLYKDDEDARKAIRSVTNSNGKSSKDYKQSTAYKGPLTIPEGEKNDFSHYVVDGRNIGILSDVHLPYHDLVALSIAVDEIKKRKVDTIILDGDIIDCYQGSDFVKDPGKRSIKLEIEMLCNFLNDLIKLFPKVKIIYKFGNHEKRWERVIMAKAPMIWGFECFELPNLIKIEYLRLYNTPLDIDFVNHSRIIEAGHLSIVHGDEWREGAFSPVNPARGFFMRAKASVLGGDKHQTSEHITKDINGRIIGAFSIGCLCDLNPRFMPLNNHNHGFCIVKMDGKDFEVKNYKIINGKLV